jgi:hypothetical protein
MNVLRLMNQSDPGVEMRLPNLTDPQSVGSTTGSFEEIGLSSKPRDVEKGRDRRVLASQYKSLKKEWVAPSPVRQTPYAHDPYAAAANAAAMHTRPSTSSADAYREKDVGLDSNAQVYVQKIKALQASCERLKQENSSLVRTLGQRKAAMDEFETNLKAQTETTEQKYKDEMDILYTKHRESVGRNKALSKEAKFIRRKLERAELDVLEEKQKVAAEKSKYEQLKQEAAFEIRVEPEGRASERQKKEKDSLVYELRVTKRALEQAKDSLRAQRSAAVSDASAANPKKKQQQVQAAAVERTWAKAEQRLIFECDAKVETERRAHNESQVMLEKYAVENEQLHQQMHLLEAAFDTPDSDIEVVQADQVKMRKQNALLRGRLTELDARSNLTEERAAKQEAEVQRLRVMLLSQENNVRGGLFAQKPSARPPGSRGNSRGSSRGGPRGGRNLKLLKAAAGKISGEAPKGAMTKVSELLKEKKQLQQQLGQQRKMLVDAHDETEELRETLAARVRAAAGGNEMYEPPAPVALRSTSTLEQDNLDLKKEVAKLNKKIEAYRAHSKKARDLQKKNPTLITGGFKFNTRYYNLQLRRHAKRRGFEMTTYNPETMQTIVLFTRHAEVAAVLGCREEVLAQDPVDVELLERMVGMVGVRTLLGGDEELHLMTSPNNASEEMLEKTVKLQAVARGRRERVHLEQKQISAAKVEAVFRGHAERRVLRQKANAAVMLQSIYRGQASREYGIEGEALDNEAVLKGNPHLKSAADDAEQRFGAKIMTGEYLQVKVKEKFRSVLTGEFELALEAYCSDTLDTYMLDVQSKELEPLLGVEAVAKVSMTPLGLFANSDQHGNNELETLRTKFSAALQLVDKGAAGKVLQLVMPSASSVLRLPKAAEEASSGDEELGAM